MTTALTPRQADALPSQASGRGGLRALDLFCGAGGASKGLQNAGFHVTGVDIKAQPRYCGDAFIQADALAPPVDLRDFDLIWASPPCQAFTRLNAMWNARERPNHIPKTRAMLESAGVPYVIENVPDAPIRADLILCGTMFGLGSPSAELRRHRHFELSWRFPTSNLFKCLHGRRERVIGVYGGHGRDRRRSANGQDFPTSDRRLAMGIDWMTGNELSEAIPPAYSEYIASAFLGQRERVAA
jgi:DNA (cytosine-5)-methyltransferase 1